MKLYCSQDVQYRLGVRFGPAPAPTDPLDSWYAHSLWSGGFLVALPNIRFTVLTQPIPPEQWGDLGPLAVQRIRESLQYYHIPQDIIDRYMPADTVPELCGAPPRPISAKMRSLASQVQKMGSGMSLQQKQDAVNNCRFVSYKEEVYEPPALEIQKLLNVPAPLPPALELEVSLDLEEYQVHRTLIVPASVPFYTLHCCLQAAFAWTYSHPHVFVLPARPGRSSDLHILGESLNVLVPARNQRRDREAVLGDYLQEGDEFRYLYHIRDFWVLNLRVRQYTLSCPLPLPVCTQCEGIAPPEGIGGVSGFPNFYRIIRDPGHPEHKKMAELAGEDWLQPDSPEAISLRMRDLTRFVSNRPEDRWSSPPRSYRKV